MKKKWLSIGLLVFIVVALFFILREIGIREIFSLIFKANPYILALAFFSLFLMYFMWSLILSHSSGKLIGKDISVFKILPIYFAGSFFNALTPGAKMGGEPVRAYYLSKKYGGNKSTHLAGILFQKFLNYGAHLILIIFSLISLMVLFGSGQYTNIVYGVITLFVFIFVLVLVIFAINKKFEWIIKKFSFLYIFFNKSFEGREEFTNYLIEKYENFLTGFNGLLKQKRFTFVFLMASVLGKLFMVGTFYFVFLSLGVDVSFFFVLISVTFVSMIYELSFIPGGIGIAEGGFIFVYSLFGIAGVDAASATLLSRGIEYFYILVVGSLSYIWLRYRG